MVDEIELSHFEVSQCYVVVLQSVVAGLNFASEDEALKFKNAVEFKLQERATRRRG